jgi:hypothetical protein
MDRTELAPPMPTKPRRRRRLGVLAALLLGFLAFGGCGQLAIHYFVPPYTWKGWVDRERRVPPKWRPEIPADNAFDTYRAMVSLLPSGASDDAFLTEWTRSFAAGEADAVERGLPRARALVEGHQGALDKLHEGASRRYVCPKPIAVATLFPEAARSRSAGRLASAAALVSHHDGQDGTALVTVEDAFALAVNLQGGPVIEGLCGVASAALAATVSSPIVRAGTASDDTLRAHALRMRELRDRLPGLAPTVCWEAEAVADTVGSMPRFDPAVVWRMPKLYSTTRGTDPSACRMLAVEWKAQDTRAWLLDRYARALDEIDKPAKENRFDEWWERARSDAEARDDWLAQEAIETLTPRLLAKRRQFVARLAAEEIIAALELYRRERGGYPEALDALAPEYLPDVPLDPFTDDPMVYRRVGGGYVLYALGPNRLDDGGVAKTRGDMEPDQVFVDDRPSAPAPPADQGRDTTGPD